MTFAQTAAARGIDFDRALANVKRRHSFSYRAQRADRYKFFTGIKDPWWSYAKPLQQPIETITDTAEYVRAWCQLNHLKV